MQSQKEISISDNALIYMDKKRINIVGVWNSYKYSMDPKNLRKILLLYSFLRTDQWIV